MYPLTGSNKQMWIQTKCRNNLQSIVEFKSFWERAHKNPNSWLNTKERSLDQSWAQKPKPTVWNVPEPWKSMKTLILSDWWEKSVWPILEPVWKIRKSPKLWFVEKEEGKFWGTTVAPVQSSWTWRVRLASLPFATWR